jgi:hypothetical protein
VLLDYVQIQHPGFLEAMTFEEREKLLEHVEAMAEAK